jgi:hypothetical protein
MTKAIDSGLLAALTSPTCQPYYAVEALFDDIDGDRYDEAGYTGNRAVRLWTGIGNRSIGGATYIGSGDILQISGLEEAADLSAKGASVTLSGISPSIMSLALGEPYQGRFVRILLGEASQSAYLEVFSGLIDKMDISHSGESVTIGLAVESKLVTLQRSNVRRYTSANHKLRYQTDTFFDTVSSLVDKEIVWGREVS